MPTNIAETLHAVLAQLTPPGATLQSPALSKRLAQLLALLEAPPAGQNPLSALKTPGVWADRPLPANPPGVPIYVKLPAAIQFVNVPASALAAQLKVEPLGRNNSQITVSPLLDGAGNPVQNSGLLDARSAVWILTDNALADEIAALKSVIAGLIGSDLNSAPRPKAPANIAALIKALQQSLRSVESIRAANALLSGSGTENDPFSVRDGLLYCKAPVTIGFPGWLPSQVNFQVENQSVKISG